MKAIKHRNIEWWMGIFLSFVLVLVIGTFSYFKMNFIFKGVQIEATVTPQKDPSLVEVSGNAKNSIYLSLNGREIYIDKNGNFSEPYYLLPGLSIITLKAKDSFGKKAEKKFEIVTKASVKAIALEK